MHVTFKINANEASDATVKSEGRKPSTKLIRNIKRNKIGNICSYLSQSFGHLQAIRLATAVERKLD